MTQVIEGASYSLPDRVIPDDGLLVSMAEHFDSFLLDWQMKHPMVFRDRVPMGQFPLFNGYSQKSYIFRGTLGPQAGLTEWTKIEPSSRPVGDSLGKDRCTYRPQTYTWSYDAIDFEGVATSWRSPIFCVNDLKFQDKAQQQLGMIIKAGAQITDQIKETFNREVYVKTAADAGKFFVLAEGGGLDFVDGSDSRVSYNPYTSTQATFPAAVLPRLSSLNFSQLDLVHQYLSDQCPDAAQSVQGGMPIYGLMIDVRDFEKFVLEDAELREDFRHARPEQLIAGYNMGFKVYRGWALMHDPRQVRFNFAKIDSSLVYLDRVLPRRATRDGIIGKVPETNPAYVTAEYGTAIAFINNAIQILVPSPVASLSSGMTFGPTPNFNGQWQWLNIQDEETNPLKETGYFFSRYEYFVKMLEYAQDIVVFLYSRCTQSERTGCAVTGADENVFTTASLASAPVAGDFSAANKTAVLSLNRKLAAGIGDRLTITNDAGTTFSAYLVASSQAPVYTIAWETGPSAVTEINDTAVVLVTVA